MPKELFEIRNFNKGIISTPSEEDIPPNAASYSLDVESTAVDGKLIGRKTDIAKTITALTAINTSAIIDSETSGKKDLIYYDGSDIMKALDFYTETPAATSIATIASGGTVNMVKNNKEVHIGMGNTSSDSPKWVGYNNHTQWGNSNAGLKYENAELISHDAFPSLYKSISIGDYLYAIQQDGTYVYKFDTTTGDYMGKSPDLKLTKTTAICTNGEDIYLIDDRTNMYVVKMDTGLVIQSERILQTSSSNITFEISDMECTANKIWYKKKGASNLYISNYLLDADVDLANKAISNVPIPSLNDPYSFGSTDPVHDNRGLIVDLAYASGQTQTLADATMTALSHTTFDLCLCKTNNSTQIAIMTKVGGSSFITYKVTISGGGTLYSYHAYPIDKCLWFIDETHDKTYLADDGKDTALPIDINTGWTGSEIKGITNLVTGGVGYRTYISDINGVIYKYPYFSSLSNYEDIFDETEASQKNELVVETTYTIDNNYLSDDVYIVLKEDQSKLYLFENNTGGKLARYNIGSNGNLSSFYPLLKSKLSMIITSGSGSSFSSAKGYFYKASYLYDGYQESPLSQSTFTSSTSFVNNRNITIEISQVDTLPSRITHLNIYRAEASDNSLSSPDSLYRLVKSIELDSTWALTSNSYWGDYRNYTFVDTFNASGATYDSITGVSEKLFSTMINRNLAIINNNTNIIADCYHREIKNGEIYMFKSLPYKYDTFDWSKDFLILPEKPLALASFNGRIFAFSGNNTYKIEPNTFYIEDTYEGVGCSGPNSFVVTEYGMCFADKNNIYLHDGRQPIPIGNAILTSNNGFGYQELYSSAPHVIFDGIRNSFVIIMSDQTDSTYPWKAWCYNLAQKKWDLWSLPSTSLVNSTFGGKEGEIYISQGTSLNTFANGTSTKNFEWQSKDIIVNRSTQDKKFYSTNKVGTANAVISIYFNVFIS